MIFGGGAQLVGCCSGLCGGFVPLLGSWNAGTALGKVKRSGASRHSHSRGAASLLCVHMKHEQQITISNTSSTRTGDKYE